MSQSQPHRPWWNPRSRAGKFVLAAVAVAVTVPAVSADRPSSRTVDAAEPTVKDGSTLAQAAVSCWAAKRTDPAAASGLFWIVTPQMSAPTRVWCDQETDGGGWALVGRGREGWTFTDAGQGNAADVTTTPTGTAAFTPATLPATAVTQLLGGLTVDRLADGVRLRQAANTAGTSWQEVRWNLADAAAWRWTFATGFPLAGATLNGVSGGTGTTRDMSFPSGKRIWTFASTTNGNRQGFNNGSNVDGSSAASSYLWEYSTAKHASPFTQVFIRPKLVEGTALAGETSVSFAAIPDGGLAAIPATTSSGRQAIASKPVGIGWGVSTEYDPNDQYPNLNTLVSSIEIVGDTVFVGGKFRYVRNGANAPLITQSYLAAFHRVTGDWISTFRPVLDGSVWALQATPDGKLLVAGNFSSVDGIAGTTALFKLDPATMSVDPAFSLAITRNAGLRPIGRALTFKGDWAYLAGRFNSATGGSPAVSNLGIGGLLKFRWATGTPDPNWRPNTDSTVEGLAASPTTDRLWMVGFFTKVSGTTAHSSASVSLTTGQRNDPPGMQTVIENSPITMYYTPAREPQWTVGEWNGFVYQGGTQHYFGRHATSDYAQTGWTNQANGDYQTQEFMDGLVYAGCHCGATNVTKPVNGPQTTTGLLSAFGAWDSDTFVRNTTFQPDLRNWNEGPWAMKTDAASGCLWVGGDFGAGPADVYLMGIAKFCKAGGPTDATPPSVPTGLTGTVEATGTRLQWSASTDNRNGALTYEILLADRVIGTTTTTNFLSPFVGGGRYFVRAMDAAGNRSATTTVVSPVDTQPITLVAFGAPWRHSADGSVPPVGWDSTANVSAWAEAPAPLGKGGIGEVSPIAAAGTTQYFVRDVQASDLASWGTVRVRLRADDGAIVRVNGVQVARANLGFGAAGHTAVAYQPVTAPGGAATREITVPRSLFVAGTNRISVELHQAVANDVDAYVDAEVVVNRTSADTVAPAAPAPLTASSRTTTAIGVAWPASPETDVAGYELRRNGQLVAYFNRNETAYLDQQLTPGTSYGYSVVAYDRSGNPSSTATAALSTTGTPPPPAPLPLATASTVWRFSGDGSAPPATWTTTADLSAWGQGAGPLGAGGMGEVTAIPTAGFTQYLAADVTVPNPAAFRQIDMTLALDDAAVVRINGTEVARANIAFGTPSPSTPAYAEKTGPAAPATIRVPADLLVAGTNRITVELHQIRTGDDAFSSVVATALTNNGDSVAPRLSTGSMSSIARTGMQLNWAAATDNAGIGYYLVRRNGAVVAVLRRGAVNYLDQQLTPGTTYNYEVVAVDTNGNASAPLPLAGTTLP